MSSKFDILQNYFGHDAFRVFQEEAVDAILAKNDLLMVLPTGGGKSLCYQLPTLLMDGVTIVVSPLLALMHDQVTALVANNISAAMMSSMQSEDEINSIMIALKFNKIKLLYIAPERLVLPSFIDLLHTLTLNFFVIDEAHCVSEWGHDFRSDYRKLSLLKENFPSTPIAAFTATATSKVKADISTALQLNNPTTLQGVIFRDNLLIQAKNRHQNGQLQLLDFLKKHQNHSGIIYTLSRKETEVLSDFLNSKGFNVKPYHAGLSPQIRNQTFEAFVKDEIEIVVATIAFGMGIDKSNIRFVVHMSLPKTIENFYQEIGRAGRDGEPSQTLLLYGAADTVKQRLYINDNPNTSELQQRHALEKLQAMSRLASSESCRHQQIARYFEDSIEACNTLCDVCQEPDYEKEDISKDAQMLLSAILRTDSKFGMGYIIDILRGSKIAKIEQNGHNTLSVYGIGVDRSKAEWQSIGERLLEIEALMTREYSVLSITQKGLAVLKGQEQLTIKKSRLHFKATKSTNTPQALPDDENFIALKTLRMELAKDKGVPPYVIFSDKTLHELALTKPTSRQDMLSINGIGEVKYERYGEAFLNLVQSFSTQEITVKEVKTTEVKPAPSKRTKKRSATYNETLELIQNDMPPSEIAEHRNLTLATILNHIHVLYDDEDISLEQKTSLFKSAESSISNPLLQWIEEGKKLSDLSTLRNNLSLYIALYDKG
jgi:ATP-dependent DNA helicase RecQ